MSIPHIHADPETLLAQRRELAGVLRAAGIGPQSDRFASLARPSIALETGGAAGRSKLGGRPDLPTGAHWPVRGPIVPRETHQFLTEDERDFLSRSAPLTFIAQIDLAHIARHVAWLPALPNSGMLYFFYDVLHQGWGFDPSDRDGFRVLWLEAEDAELASARKPDEDLPEYPEVAFGARYKLDPVDSETRAFHDADSTDQEAGDRYQEWLIENRFDTHKLGGWPNVQQGEMESECALVTNGIYCGDATGYGRPEARAILSEEKDWHLLLQIGSDDAAEMIWGDLGSLYVWIRDRDLKSRRFDKCWTILQCG